MEKKVSVIIPNYNYARFLQRRIDCIVNQTIKPAEIIFLDDCSTDNSLEVAREILSKTDIPYRIIPNEVNQGVFKQWLKGIELTQNDYFWIAEADDYCELNFLETLLPAFDDKDVVISYCDSAQVNEHSSIIQLESDVKNSHFSLGRWSHDFISLGEDEVKNYLILFNTIPNVSAVLFNKSLLDISEIKQTVSEYKKAGDWFIYMLVLLQGNNKLAYFSTVVSYFTRHNDSLSVNKDNGIQLNIEILTTYEYMLQHVCFSKEQLSFILNSLLSFFSWCDYNLISQSKLFRLMEYFPDNVLMHELHVIVSKNECLLIKFRKENERLRFDYNVLLTERDNIKLEYDQLLVDRDNIKFEYDQLLVDRDNIKFEYDQLLVDRDNIKFEYNNLLKERNTITLELSGVYNSKSWKISAPLRYFNKFIYKFCRLLKK